MKDLIFSLIYNFSSRLILLVISIFSVKILSIAEYGELSYILVLVTTLAIISLFGGGAAVNRSFSMEEDKVIYPISNKIFISNIIISLIISIVLLIASCFFIKDLVQVIFIFLIFFIMSINSIIEGAMYGTGEYKNLAFNSLIVFFASLILAYILILEFRVLGALIALFLYRILIFSLNIRVLLKKKIIRSVPLKELFSDPIVNESLKKISLPTFFSAMLVAPVMMLLLHFLKTLPNGINEVAYFSWVNQIYTMAVFFPSILTGFLISKMSSELSSSYQKLIQYTKYNLMFGLILSVFLLIIKPFLLGWAGEKYIEASSGMYNIMLLAICTYCLNAAFGSYWTSVNKAHLGLIANFIWAVASVTISYFLIQMIGSGTAIFSSLIFSYVLVFTLQLVLSYCREKNKYYA